MTKILNRYTYFLRLFTIKRNTYRQDINKHTFGHTQTQTSLHQTSHLISLLSAAARLSFHAFVRPKSGCAEARPVLITPSANSRPSVRHNWAVVRGKDGPPSWWTTADTCIYTNGSFLCNRDNRLRIKHCSFEAQIALVNITVFYHVSISLVSSGTITAAIRAAAFLLRL